MTSWVHNIYITLVYNSDVRIQFGTGFGPITKLWLIHHNFARIYHNLEMTRKVQDRGVHMILYSITAHFILFPGGSCGFYPSATSQNAVQFFLPKICFQIQMKTRVWMTNDDPKLYQSIPTRHIWTSCRFRVV